MVLIAPSLVWKSSFLETFTESERFLVQEALHRVVILFSECFRFHLVKETTDCDLLLCQFLSQDNV
jgi:hypothetical protein